MTDPDSIGPDTDQHMDDELLARFLDAELSVREREMCEEHLRLCTPCADAITALRRDADRLREVIRRGDGPVPSLPVPTSVTRKVSSWKLRTTVMAASAAALLVALSNSPTRAWILDTFDQVASRLLDRRAEPLAVEPTAEPEPTNEFNVSIPFTDDLLAVRVVSRQQSGDITFRVAEGAEAYARVVNGGGEELVVTDELRILNITGSTSSYIITVPVQTSTVELQIGGEPVLRYQVNEIGQSWSIDLSAR